MSLPKHIAIIMDGNGRWGLKKNKTRNYGHLHGIKTVEKIIHASIKKRIKYSSAIFNFTKRKFSKECP